MKLPSRRILANAFFYPGCGTDLQPLVRFSHLTDYFIYVDYLWGESIVASALRDALENPIWHGMLSLEDERSRTGWNTSQDEGRFLDDLAARISLQEFEDYRGNRGFDPWVREFTFHRTFGEIERPLKLLYIGDEAFRTYYGLFAKSGNAPRFVCTIQGGMGWTQLESPGGSFASFLSGYPQAPDYWVRGKWLDDNDPTWSPLTGGDWNLLVQSFSDWTSISSSGVETFAQNSAAPQLEDYTRLEHGARAIALRREPLHQADLTGFDAVFISTPLADGLDLPADTSVHSIDAGARLEQVLDWIDRVRLEYGYRRIATLALGYEDEGELLRHWVQSAGPPGRLEFFLNHDLEFADLRGWQPRGIDETAPANEI